ncbi:uncharacterized protein AB675_9196 [Cyphellophora attinorum]|uniref:3-hydroxyisobutyrate dehydrogenase n=1 Tax=Cyphellophora attinorum TaxID=1664694 RepID=A0A0N1HBP0_9EURO|nr:uncharacterized protein AB675_9196 [Phialophora attinorum]KPI41510.1 hypothetical protein AB675_9196 [Phialophora attinorum]
MAHTTPSHPTPSPPPPTTYGWIGIGNMGYGMAMNIARKIPATAHLLINDLRQDQVAKFLAEAVDEHGLDPAKVSAVDAPAEIVQRAEIILTSLPHDEAVKEVFENAETGIIAGLSRPTHPEEHTQGHNSTVKLVLETSTIAPTTTLPLHEAITAMGTHTLTRQSRVAFLQPQPEHSP